MSNFILILFSLSASGALVSLFVFLIHLTLGKWLSKSVGYYLWLIPLCRSVIPSPFGNNLINRLVHALYTPKNREIPPQVYGQPGRQVIIGSNVTAPAPADDSIFNIIALIWLIGALILLIKKVVSYQSYYKYIQSSWMTVDDPEMLDILSDQCEKLKIRGTIELCVNPIISSPLLLGVFRPVIVVPEIPSDCKMFSYILYHELVHYKRRDSLYIWFMQLILCVHWLNPAFYFVGRFVSRDRELACDEGVLRSCGKEHKKNYGATLIESFFLKGRYQEKHTTVALLENKSLLKDRLIHISKFTKIEKSTVIMGIIAVLLTVLMTIPFGSYSVHSAQVDLTIDNESSVSQGFG